MTRARRCKSSSTGFGERPSRRLLIPVGDMCRTGLTLREPAHSAVRRTPRTGQRCLRSSLRLSSRPAPICHVSAYAARGNFARPRAGRAPGPCSGLTAQRSIRRRALVGRRGGLRGRRRTALLTAPKSPPQTNEVRRAAAVSAGLHLVDARFGVPLDLLELGTSAGLNLQVDRFAVDWTGPTEVAR